MSKYEWVLGIKYSQDQPRVPAGGPGGGQWTSGGGSSDFSTAASEGNISSSRRLNGGVTNPVLVHYEDDGSGVWKPLVPDNPGGHDGNSEVAAYRLDQMLGGETVVPETVFAESKHGEAGTSQRYVHESDTGWDVALKLELRNNEERTERMVLLDYVTGNKDRHNGNILFGPYGELYAIDNGHAGWGYARDGGSSHGGYYEALTIRHVNMGVVGGFQLSPKLFARVGALDRATFDKAMEGVSENRYVNLNFAWAAIVKIQESGGLLEW